MSIQFSVFAHIIINYNSNSSVAVAEHVTAKAMSSFLHSFSSVSFKIVQRVYAVFLLFMLKGKFISGTEGAL